MSGTEAAAQIAELFAAHQYRRAPPALAGCWSADADLLAYFLDIIRQRNAACPAEYSARFQRAYVFEGCHVLIASRGWLAHSVADYPAAAECLPGLLSRIGSGAVQTLPPCGKPTVVIGKAGAQNYGHTLVEILPKIVNLARSPLRDVRLLLPGGMERFHPVILQLCGHFGITAELVVATPDTLLLVEDLVYLGPVSQHNTRKSSTLLSLRDTVWKLNGVKPAPRRKFYIERPASEHRSLSNGAQAAQVFAAAGYETVHPAQMTFAEQVTLFSQASHIAGPLGAGLTNMLMAPPECRIMMIDPGLADYFFWDLAALAGQHFTWFFTGPVSHYSWPLASGSFAVDLNGLRYALEKFAT